MRIASVADVKARLSEYLRASADGPVIVTRNGRPAGVLLGITDEDDLERLILLRSHKLRALFESGVKQIAEGKSLPHDEFWRRLDASYAAKPKTKRRKKAS